MKARIVAFVVFAVVSSGGAFGAEPVGVKKFERAPLRPGAGKIVTDQVVDHLHDIKDPLQRQAEATRIAKFLAEDFQKFAPPLKREEALALEKTLVDSLVQLAEKRESPDANKRIEDFLQENGRLVGSMPKSVIDRLTGKIPTDVLKPMLAQREAAQLIKARTDSYNKPADIRTYVNQGRIPLQLGAPVWREGQESPIGLPKSVNDLKLSPNGKSLGENFNTIVAQDRDSSVDPRERDPNKMGTVQKIEAAYDTIAEVLNAKTPDALAKALDLGPVDVARLSETERNLIEMMRLQHMAGNSGSEELSKFVDLLKKAATAKPDERIRSLLGFNRVQQEFHGEYTKNLVESSTFRTAAGEATAKRIEGLNKQIQDLNAKLTAEERKSPRDEKAIEKLVIEMNKLTLERTALVLEVLAKIPGSQARTKVMNDAMAAAEDKLLAIRDELRDRLFENMKLSIDPKDAKKLEDAKKEAEENATFAVFCCGGSSTFGKRKQVCHRNSGPSNSPSGVTRGTHGPGQTPVRAVSPQRGVSPPRP